MTSPLALAQQLLQIIDSDRDDRLLKIDRYLRGDHDEPYMPDNADDEYRLLARRCVTNMMTLIVGTPSQAMYVDTFRRGDGLDAESTQQMDHWQRSHLQARQLAVHRGAFSYGHAFVLTEIDPRTGRSVSKGLSALTTSAVFDDPANDINPVAALRVLKWPRSDGTNPIVRGVARLYDERYAYDVTFGAANDPKSVRVSAGRLHGSTECPVTRFAATVDLEGRTTGVIEPMIPLQDRINQTVFDLLVAQTYGSHQVRYATGMAPPLVRDEDGVPILDGNGNYQAVPINHSAKRFLFAEDENVKFGTLPGGPLEGFISSIDMSIRHLSAIAQVPPHHLLGQIANLSAEALQAAETSLLRKIEEFKAGFGESWERVFRIAAELDGDTAESEDFKGEVIWRDMEQKSLAQAADALGKMAEQLGIPRKGLWQRVPNVTQNELDQWTELADQEPEQVLASAVTRASAPASSSIQ